MEALYIYLLGCLIWAIGYYVNEVYIDKDHSKKRYIIYKSISTGFVSWFGIIIVVAIFLAAVVLSINEWIENKLR